MQKIKSEAMEKIERRVMFTDLTDVGFDEHSVRIPITELHLDRKVIDELQAKKEIVMNRQQNEPKILETRKGDEVDQQESKSSSTVDTNGKKKKNKKSKRKNKGLSAFLDGDAEKSQYAKDAMEDIE